jgi:preprotein translocase subunit YajC
MSSKEKVIITVGAFTLMAVFAFSINMMLRKQREMIEEQKDALESLKKTLGITNNFSKK